MSVSSAQRILWQDSEYRARQTASRKAKWAEPAFREKMCAERATRRHSPETRAKMRVIQLAAWRDPEYRRKHVEPRRGGMTVVERQVKAELEASGWTVFRGGWPDFLLTNAAGEIKAVEVKGGRDGVRPHQIQAHDLLRRVGLPVEVVRIKGVR